jgi:hypothetical protein
MAEQIGILEDAFFNRLEPLKHLILEPNAGEKGFSAKNRPERELSEKSPMGFQYQI